MSKTSIFGAVLFSLIGVCALVLGAVQARQGIRMPFAPSSATLENAQKISETNQVDPNKDTDGDGISDVDELGVYHTSPYIKDSDSDGMDDKAEIAQGTDPNCPQGTNCAVVAPTPPPQNNLGPDDLLPAGSTGTTLLPNPSATTPPSAGVTVGENAAAVREALRQAGVPEEALKNIDDASLMQLYAETQAEVKNNN